MKLLYITNQVCGSGGLERVLSIKTDYLIENYGCEIHFITLNQFDAELFYSFNNKIHHHDIVAKGNPLSYITSYAKGLNRIVKKIKPDVISVCDDGLKGFFVPIVIKKPCPMIYERHVSKDIFLSKNHNSLKSKLITYFKNTLMHFGGSFYNKFVVLTNDNLKEWKLKNLKVISNPLSFYPEESADLNNKVVLAVGRQSYQKGYDQLLKIWQPIAKKYPDWELKIYGKIDQELKLSQLAQELGITTSVSFYAPVKNIISVYTESSIYVMSSRFEGFGMVLIEAMACGVPVVSFDCHYGPKDIITPNEDGILVENNDLDSFSKSIEELIKNSELRKQMGKMAKQNVNRFFPDQIVPQWNELFKNLIGK